MSTVVNSAFCSSRFSKTLHAFVIFSHAYLGHFPSAARQKGSELEPGMVYFLHNTIF